MTPPTPPTQHSSIALWRGYVAAQFYVRGEESDEALHVSQPFRTWRFPWQEKKALQDDPAAQAALAALEADLLAGGWERVRPRFGDESYELRFRRVEPDVSSPELVERPVSAPLPQLAAVPRQQVPTNGARATVTVETFTNGYRAALGRFTAAADRCEPPGDTYLPLFETLNWAARLIDNLGHPDVTTAQGLRWARNAVQLHWAKALEPREVHAPRPIVAGERSEIIRDTVALDWFWLPLERMPKPRASKHEPEQREAYVARLAGQRAQEPLHGLLDELAPYLPPTVGTTLR